MLKLEGRTISQDNRCRLPLHLSLRHLGTATEILQHKSAARETPANQAELANTLAAVFPRGVVGKPTVLNGNVDTLREPILTELVVLHCCCSAWKFSTACVYVGRRRHVLGTADSRCGNCCVRSSPSFCRPSVQAVISNRGNEHLKEQTPSIPIPYLFWTEVLQLISVDAGLPVPLPFRSDAAAAAAAAEFSAAILRPASNDASFLENRAGYCRFSSQTTDGRPHSLHHHLSFTTLRFAWTVRGSALPDRESES